MPSAMKARSVDMSNLRRVQYQANEPAPPQAPPDQPAHLKLSPVFITSLPAMSTDVDGITRQFYGRVVPTRRSLLP